MAGKGKTAFMAILVFLVGLNLRTSNGEASSAGKDEDRNEKFLRLQKVWQQEKVAKFLTDKELLALAEAAVRSSSKKEHYHQEGSGFLPSDDEAEGSGGDFLDTGAPEDTRVEDVTIKTPTTAKDGNDEEEEQDYYYFTPDSKDIANNGTDDDNYYFEDEYYENKPTKNGASLPKSTSEKAPTPVKDTNVEDDLLYEYHNEIEEEDYDMSVVKGKENVHLSGIKETTGGSPVQGTDDIPSGPPANAVPANTGILPSLEEALSSSRILLMVASALVSFLLFSVTFALCCCYKKRKEASVLGKAKKMILETSRGGKGSPSLMPFVIDATTVSTYRASAPPPSSIVKNYQRVPTSTMEFLSGMENANHQLYFQESEKPLLP